VLERRAAVKALVHQDHQVTRTDPLQVVAQDPGAVTVDLAAVTVIPEPADQEGMALEATTEPPEIWAYLAGRLQKTSGDHCRGPMAPPVDAAAVAEEAAPAAVRTVSSLAVSIVEQAAAGAAAAAAAKEAALAAEVRAAGPQSGL